MKVLLPAGVAAALMFSSTAFAAGTAPVTALSSGAHHHAAAYQPKNAATTALNLLEADGDGDFTNFHPVGHDYAATVSQNGKTFPVTIDPATRQITHG